MKRIAEALEIMMPAFRPLGTERVQLHDALGRLLSRDVLARSDLPPFDNSAMDGYAVRAQDTSEDAVLPVDGESRAGGPAPEPLGPGRAMRIFTGAVMPEGADAVVVQEDTRTDDVPQGRVRILQKVEPGRHLRARASDLAADTAMLRAGDRLGPGEIGLLASQRVGSVDVHRRPLVAILCTGDELRDLTDPAEPGTIVNSNAYALAAQVRQAGGVPWVLPNVPDDLDVTVRMVGEALSADLVLTCGGVSVGSYDLVKAAFEKNDVQANFWKVRIKPGKPLTFGLRDGTPVVGLPGNPVSAMVTFEIFVRPGIRAMLGDRRPFRPLHQVVLAAPHRHATGRPELARATVERREGRLFATMLRLQGSGSLPSMVNVDAFVLLDADRSDFEADEILPAVLLGDETGAAQPPFDA